MKKIFVLLVAVLACTAVGNLQAAQTPKNGVSPLEEILSQIQIAVEQQTAQQVKKIREEQEQNTVERQDTIPPVKQAVVCGECGRTPEQVRIHGHSHKASDIVWVPVSNTAPAEKVTPTDTTGAATGTAACAVTAENPQGVVCGECGRTPEEVSKHGHSHKTSDIVWVPVKKAK